MTSLDMAGCSLTLFWLDEELEELWGRARGQPRLQEGGRRSH